MANALDTMSRPTSNRCHTTGGTTANQGHRKKDTQTDFVDEISTIVTDFVDEIPSPDPGLTDTSVKAPPTIQPNHARQYANTVARGLTNKVPPKVLRERIRFVALEMIDRFRYIRTLDLAASCFAERPFPAAIAAAQRAMRGLKADGLVMEYVTDRHQHVYALTKAGADWLNIRVEGQAKASTRHASELTNPEHTLWSNFIQTCCEQRGLHSLTEKQLLDGFRSDASRPSGGLLEITTYSGIRKSLRPDVLAFHDQEAVWFEIDRSSRGSGRKQDLEQLFRSIGKRLTRSPNTACDEDIRLRHVVIVCLTPVIMRTAQRILLESHHMFRKPDEAMWKDATLNRSGRCVAEKGDAAVYEIWAMEKLSQPKNGYSKGPAIIGHVTIQLLPTWLASYRTAGKANRKNARGWFEENYLPYTRAPQTDGWNAPTTSLAGGTYNWAQIGF